MLTQSVAQKLATERQSPDQNQSLKEATGDYLLSFRHLLVNRSFYFSL